MRKALHYFCLLLILVVPSFLTAQSLPRLSIISIERNPSADTIIWAGSATVLEYQVIYQNIGQGSLDGPVRMMVQYPLGSAPETRVITSVNNMESLGKDTVSFTDTVNTLTGARYKGGGNIIVIWPKSDMQAQAPDTGYHGVTLIDTSIANATKDPYEFRGRVKVFPNPVRSALNIQYLKDRHKLEYVRIITQLGQVSFMATDPVGKLDFENLANGLYFIEIRYNDGIRGSYRVQVAH